MDKVLREVSSLFFDEYPAFYESSMTAVFPRRLDLRHKAMIEANRDILAGARVLDLASHDGRWSFAALKAGAKHVTGVEARAELVDNANKLFAGYGIPTEDYQFVQGDMFRILQEHKFDVDVVLCLGFVYHTLRYGELFHGIIDTDPQYCILDTKVMRSDEPLVKLFANRTASAGPRRRGRPLAGRPGIGRLSVAARAQAHA